jgi:hypothetical protein
MFDLPRLAQFCRGGRIAAEHFDASPENLQTLGAFVDRWVVHIRDPRSVLLSWVHHLNRLYQERDVAPFDLLYVCPTPPEEYFGYSFAEQVDWNIENFLPNVLHWIRTWVETYDSGRYTILLTTYSDIVASEDDFLFKVLDFCGIPRDRFCRPAMKKDMGLHFRIGREDEWLECLTPEQLARTRNMIGSELVERFRWPR